MIVWKRQTREAEDCGEKNPPVCTYIAECFIKISEHLSYRPNFMNYPFREDMVGDGIENCILYAHNFDEKKSKNPFSYFTQIIYYAFLRRIEKEKKQAYIKYKMMKINDEDGEYTKWIRDKDFEDYNKEIKLNSIERDEIDYSKLEFVDDSNKCKQTQNNSFLMIGIFLIIFAIILMLLTKSS